MVYTAVRRLCLLFSKLLSQDACVRVSTCLALHPSPTSLKPLIAELSGVSAYQRGNLWTFTHAPLAATGRRVRALTPPAGCTSSAHLPGPQPHALLSHSHTDTPQIASTRCSRCALTSCSQRRELASTHTDLAQIRKQPPEFLLSETGKFYMRRGTHCPPSTDIDTSTGTRTDSAFPFFLTESQVWSPRGGRPRHQGAGRRSQLWPKGRRVSRG